MKKDSFMSVHPLVIFWLGVLTGAVLVGLAFFYRVLTPTDYESSLIRDYNRYSVPKIENQIGDPNGSIVDPYSIGDPNGSKVPFIDPSNFIGDPNGS